MNTDKAFRFNASTKATQSVKSTISTLQLPRLNRSHWLGLAIACVSSQVFAETAELGPLTVTAARGSDLERLDLSTTVISRQQIESAPQATVDQILNHIPGVFVPQASTFAVHPTASVVSLRGFGNSFGVKTLVMVDGIPINDGYFRTVDWTQIPKSRVERIEVIRGGGATSLWGNLALGGVINIVTKEPEAGHSTLDVAYGSRNTQNLSLSSGLVSTENFKLGLDVSTLRTDGYKSTPSRYRNADSSATSGFTNDAQLSAYFDPDNGDRYYIKALMHDKHSDGVTWDGGGNDWKKAELQAGASHLLSLGSLNANAWINRTWFGTRNGTPTGGYSLATPQAGRAYLSQDEDADYDSGGGSVFWALDLDRVRDIKVGLDLRDIRINNDRNHLLDAAGNQTSVFDTEGEHRFLGVFAQGTWTPEDVPLDVTLGLREDFWWARHGSINGTSSAGSLDQSLDDARFTHFDPRLGARYYFGNGFELHGALYRNFSAPGMNQMYRSYVSGSTYNQTNPSLEPETNFGKELGLDYKTDDLTLSATVFHNHLQNFIDYPNVCTGPIACAPLVAGTGLSGVTAVRQYQNVGDATLKGLELLGDYRFSDTLSFTGGFTRTMGYLTSSDAVSAPTHQQLGQLPSWVLTSGAIWNATDRLTLNLQVKRVPDYWYNTAHTVKNDATTQVDLGANYRLTKQVELYATAQNLGNKNYDDTGAQGPTTAPQLGQPRTVLGGFRFSF
ncbi:TonB-dependent receptor [Pseudomonas sp. NPDC088444]|uniref:TonB-dependent receptor n=1 Tax=Pseudomonas sp. NPDC088444 TaxID=3364456 RepID=UPI003850BE1A